MYIWITNTWSKLYFVIIKIGESNTPNKAISQEVQSIPPVLGVGSAIQLGDPPQYGVVKRIENDPVLNKEIVEVEMVSLYLVTYVCEYKIYCWCIIG